MAPDAGRFAPSPSADLHIGNLRTAVLAWLFARSTGRRFLMRVDDLDDRTHADIANRQLDDLAAIGLTLGRAARMADPSTRHRYDDGDRTNWPMRGLLYECYCSRRDIAAGAASAARAAGSIPGNVPRTDRRRTRDPARRDRPPTGAAAAHRRDRLHGHTICCTATTPASSTTSWSVAETASRPTTSRWSSTTPPQGIDQVVRGDDLLPSSPRQAYLAKLLGYPEPTYAHVALVLNEDGARLAKRDGAVTLAEIGVQRAFAQIASRWAGRPPTWTSCWRGSTRRGCRGNPGYSRPD